MGIFGETYDSAVKGQNSDSASASGTGLNASDILKPIEEFAGYKQQIFKHERVSQERTSVSKSQISEVASPPGVHDQLNTSQSREPQLAQLGIRHVKLDQENWVPSPELVPCCVRCFSIATYVLNYQYNDDKEASVDEVKQMSV